MTSTWNGTAGDGNWSDAGNWNSPNGIASGVGNAADFASLAPSTPTTVNLDASYTIAALNFNAGTGGSWTISSSDNSVLTLANTSGNALINTFSQPVTISATLSGTFGNNTASALVVFGGQGHTSPQAVNLTGSNTFGGGWLDLENGNLSISSAAALNGLTTLYLDTNYAGTAGNALTFNGPNISLSQAVVLNRPTPLNVNASNATLTGNITGSSTSAFPIIGGFYNSTLAESQGSLTLSGNNTNLNSYSIASDTTLIAASTHALGSNASAGITVSSGGTLGFTGSINYNISENVFINNTGVAVPTGGAGAIENISGTNSFPGNISLGATGNNINAIGVTAGSLTLSGNINSSSGVPLQKLGPGLLALSGTGSTYTGGTIISNGTVSIGSDANLGAAYTGALSGVFVNTSGSGYASGDTVTLANGGPASASAVNVTVSSGKVTGLNLVSSSGFVSDPTFVFHSTSGIGATGLAYVQGLVTLDGGTLQTTAPVTSIRPVAITANTGTFDTDGVADNFLGAFTGAGNLTVTSSTPGGSLLLSGANTYSGGTNLSSGTLQVGSATALPVGGFSSKAVGTIVAIGASLDLDGTAGVNQIITLNGSGVGGHGALTNSNTSSTAIINNGVATAAITSAGAAYSTVPSITVSSPASGTPASATAALGLSSATFTLIGHSSYDTFSVAPNVVITGGGGSGATAIAVLNSSGGISSINVTDPGIGYTSAPTIAISGGTIIATGSSGTGSYYTSNATHFAVSGVQINNPGSGYTSTPAFTLSGGNAVITASVSSIVLGSPSTIGGAGNITLNVPITGNYDLTKTDAGTLTLDASNTYDGGTNVAGGTLVLSSSAALPVNTKLTVASGATVVIANHGSGAVSVPQIGTLTNAGSIDITNNALIVTNGSAGTINEMVAQAYNNGAWNGTSTNSGIITSSTAANDTTGLTAVGVATGLTSFEGQAVLPGDVLVKYTYYGDANLDGQVDGTDYSRIDNGYLSAGALTGWQNGDFNYDGVIDGSDYTLIDNAYNTQGASLAEETTGSAAVATAQIAGATSAVPEPGSVSLLAIASIGMLRRRRRN